MAPLPQQLEGLSVGTLKSVELALRALQNAGVKEIGDVEALKVVMNTAHHKMQFSETTYTSMCAWANTSKHWRQAPSLSDKDTAPSSLLGKAELDKQVASQNAKLTEVCSKFGMEPAGHVDNEFEAGQPKTLEARQELQSSMYRPKNHDSYFCSEEMNKRKEGLADKNREHFEKYRELAIRNMREHFAMGKDDLNLELKTHGEGFNVMFMTAKGSPFEAGWKAHERLKPPAARPPRPGSEFVLMQKPKPEPKPEPKEEEENDENENGDKNDNNEGEEEGEEESEEEQPAPPPKPWYPVDMPAFGGPLRDWEGRPREYSYGKTTWFVPMANNPFEGGWEHKEVRVHIPSRPPKEGIVEPKPREYVSVHVGGAGCGMGKAFWQKLNAEHGLGADGKVAGNGSAMGVLSSCYAAGADGSYIPRAIFVDANPASVADVKSIAAFADTALVSGSGDTGFWAPARDLGGDFYGKFGEAVRKQVEAVGNLDSLLLTHACAGGMGSGGMEKILQELNAAFPKKGICTLSLLEPWTTPASWWNTWYSLRAVQELGTLCMLVDNEGLGKHAQGTTHADLNAVTARILANVTAPLRIAPLVSASTGTKRLALSELMTNVVPYPRIKFVIPGLNSPIPDIVHTYNEEPTIPQAPAPEDDIDQEWSSPGRDADPVAFPTTASSEAVNSGMAAMKIEDTPCGYSSLCFSNQRLRGDVPFKEIATAVMARGVVSKDVQTAIQAVKVNPDFAFCDWSPVAFNVGSFRDPVLADKADLLYLSHSGAIGNLLNSFVNFDDWNNNVGFESLVAQSGGNDSFITEGLEDISSMGRDYNDVVAETAECEGEEEEG
eukprot:TRINITY_DN111662_c0_g1_i1.p1 TRINITY_DN111662_c0_g1~~TRINITY_DN111662_c0_g1_i1.p1  ORF type:complete len:834 (+),score=190.22 TRINITY_DN111662_c0_g1_i1:128-2629(+)